MTNLIRISLAALLALTAAACGDDTGGGSGGGGTDDGGDSTTSGDTTTSGSSTFTCCINGTNYSCPDQASVDACFSMDASGCTETGTNPDGTCS